MIDLMCFGPWIAAVFIALVGVPVIWVLARRRSQRASAPESRGETLWDRHDEADGERAAHQSLSAMAAPLDGLAGAFIPGSGVPAVKRLVNARGARSLTAEEAPDAFDVLEEVVTASGLPQYPVLYTIDHDAVNAWSAGAPSASGIALSRGLLAAFPKDELRAVVAALVARVTAGAVATGVTWRTAGQSEAEQAYDTALAVTYTSDEQSLLYTKDPEPLIRALERTAVSDVVLPMLDWREGSYLWAWPGTGYDMMQDSLSQAAEHFGTGEAGQVFAGIAGAALQVMHDAEGLRIPQVGPLPVERTEELRLENLRRFLRAAAEGVVPGA